VIEHGKRAKSEVLTKRTAKISTPKAFAHHGRHGDQDGQAEQAFDIRAPAKPTSSIGAGLSQAESLLSREFLIESTGRATRSATAVSLKAYYAHYEIFTNLPALKSIKSATLCPRSKRSNTSSRSLSRILRRIAEAAARFPTKVITRPSAEQAALLLNLRATFLYAALVATFLRCFFLFEPANLRSRFRSETNTSIALVPFSEPRTRLSRFVFASDFLFALERVRFTHFIKPLIQRS
jgi:hypothetical protein